MAVGKRFFRLPSNAEIRGAESVTLDIDYDWPYTPVPNEVIPAGNAHTVMASGYGYRTFGQLMCKRQTLQFC